MQVYASVVLYAFFVSPANRYPNTPVPACYCLCSWTRLVGRWALPPPPPPPLLLLLLLLMMMMMMLLLAIDIDVRH